MINVNVAASTGFHLEKWTRVCGKIILRENLGGKGTVCVSAPSRGVWTHPLQKIFDFRPSAIASRTFPDHLWFSNDMEQKE